MMRFVGNKRHATAEVEVEENNSPKEKRVFVRK